MRSSSPGITSTWPPVGYYVGCILAAFVIVFIEKSSHVTAGGVGGLGIALYGFTDWSVGVLNIAVKVVLFVVVYFLGGRRTALWTIVSALLMGGSTIVFEQVPMPFHVNPYVAFGILVTIGEFPTGLLLSRGYSTGGFSSIAQVLSMRGKSPIWLTMLICNGSVIILMDLAFGHLSGVLTLIATAWEGVSIQMWTKWCGHLFPVRDAERIG